MPPRKQAWVGAFVCALRFAAAQTEDRALEHYRRASQLFLQSRFQETAEELSRSLALNARQPRAIKLLGLCYHLVEKYALAESTFRRAIELDARDAEAWYLLGRLYYAQNFFDKALPALQNSVRHEPRDHRARECLGLTLDALGRNESALAELAEAVRWNGARAARSHTPDLNYGVLLYKAGRLPEAEKHLLRSRDLNPGDWQPHFELGKLYGRLERFEAAVAELKASVAAPNLKPEDRARAWRVLAQTLFRMGRDEEARQAIAMAEGTGP